MKRLGLVIAGMLILAVNLPTTAKASEENVSTESESKCIVCEVSSEDMSEEELLLDEEGRLIEASQCKHTSPIGVNALHTSMRQIRKVHNGSVDSYWFECVFCGYQMRVDVTCDCND